MTAAQWLTRWSGRATFRQFWIPLLEAKLGDAWPEANAAFIWATMQRLTAARRAGIGDERFGAVPGGYARVLTVIGDRLRHLGATVTPGARVVKVERTGNHRFAVTTCGAGDGDASAVTMGSEFDHVLVTTSPRAAAAVCPDLDDATRRRMNGVRYRGVVCASVLLRAPLSPYYLTYLMDELPFTAVVEMTALIPPAWINGHALVYLPRYCAPDDPMFEMEDSAIEEQFLAGLRRVHRVDAGDIVAVRVARAREVFPLPVLSYSESVPPPDTGCPGLAFVSSAQIVNGTLNVNETVALADRALARLGVVAPLPARR
jgi:protoporphyrinogen oxidase